jgi:hypothetical protein
MFVTPNFVFSRYCSNYMHGFFDLERYFAYPHVNHFTLSQREDMRLSAANPESESCGQNRRVLPHHAGEARFSSRQPMAMAPQS